MKKTIFLLSLASVVLTGCPKHEVIPAPTPKVELEGHLEGVINGATVELTPNVGGYLVDATKARIVPPAPAPASAVYYSTMKSSQTNVSVRIGMGSILWDSSISSDPSVNQFNAFFKDPANEAPAYSLLAADGFEVVYRDGSGFVWTTKDEASNTVLFTDVVQESDSKGDYSKFTCTFSCTAYRTRVIPNTNPPQEEELSVTLQDMVFTGWFKR